MLFFASVPGRFYSALELLSSLLCHYVLPGLRSNLRTSYASYRLGPHVTTAHKNNNKLIAILNNENHNTNLLLLLFNYYCFAVFVVRYCSLNDTSGYAVSEVGLWRLVCWDCGFESRRRHGRLFLVSVVYCQVEVSASCWSVVQRNPIECGVSEYDHEAAVMRGLWPTKGLLLHEKKLIAFIYLIHC